MRRGGWIFRGGWGEWLWAVVVGGLYRSLDGSGCWLRILRCRRRGLRRYSVRRGRVLGRGGCRGLGPLFKGFLVCLIYLRA